jgi:hypothetical protein
VVLQAKMPDRERPKTADRGNPFVYFKRIGFTLSCSWVQPKVARGEGYCVLTRINLGS